MKGLKKGDLVIMHTCGEALSPKNKGKIWVCESDEFKHKPSYEYGSIFLKGFSGSFCTDFLEKINVEQNVNSVQGLKQFVNGVIHDYERLVLSYEQAETLMTDFEKKETAFYKTFEDMQKENHALANQVGDMLAAMKEIYELSAEDGISKKLDRCYCVARKYVEGVFN
jgi:hypothetical protein